MTESSLHCNKTGFINTAVQSSTEHLQALQQECCTYSQFI